MAGKKSSKKQLKKGKKLQSTKAPTVSIAYQKIEY